MLTVQRGVQGACDSYKVNSVHCEHVGTDSTRTNVTVNTPEGELNFFIGSDSNSSVDQVAPRIASSIDKDITLYLDTDRNYLYAIDNTLPETDSNHQHKITGGEGHYSR